MATFGVKVKKIDVEPHPNADRLEIAKVDGYQCVVAKDKFKSGDLVAYIPEQALVPLEIQQELGLEGKLAGKDKNRVKSVRLRGTLSQGLVYPLQKRTGGWLLDIPSFGVMDVVVEGQDVTDHFQVEKYEPPIPVHMAGEVFNAMGNTLKYDIENWKNYPEILQHGEEVVFTEKLHGTWGCIGVVPEEKASEDAGRFIITSKGLSSKGLAFKLNEANKDNLYIRAARESGLMDRLPEFADLVGSPYLYVLGEVFGKGVQDLQYGLTKPSLRSFDIFVGHPQKGRYLHDKELDMYLNELGIPRVPILYRGPFSVGEMRIHTDGATEIEEGGNQIREGIVMRPRVERNDLELGRVQLKSVSEYYLDRSGGTEFN